MKKSKLTVNSTPKPKALPPAPGNACGSPVSTNTKASGENNGIVARDDKGGQALTPAKTVGQFFLKLAEQKNPSPEDVDHLRKLIVSTPAAWPLATSMTPASQQSLIGKMGGPGAGRALLLAELDILKKQMDYDNSPVLVRMHIDHLLTAWLRLHDAENKFNNVSSGENMGVESGQFWQDFLAAAQNRFLRAGEALARIQRLALITPALQINIAHEGGKQVNVQGAPLSPQAGDAYKPPTL
jgi:hypothetical protein